MRRQGSRANAAQTAGLTQSAGKTRDRVSGFSNQMRRGGSGSGSVKPINPTDSRVHTPTIQVRRSGLQRAIDRTRWSWLWGVAVDPPLHETAERPASAVLPAPRHFSRIRPYRSRSVDPADNA